MRFGFVACLSLALLTSAEVARSEARPFSRVVLLLPACDEPGLRSDELREAVALDLRDEGLALAPKGEFSLQTDVLVRVETTCGAGSELKLHAEFLDERHTRPVDLRELPSPQRARALSLALAELLSRFSRAATETATDVQPSSVPEASPAAPAAAAAPSSRSTPKTESVRPAVLPSPAVDREPSKALVRPTARYFRLSLAPELRFFVVTSLWGGRALVHYGAWSFGMDLLTSQAQLPQGSVRTILAHSDFAYAWVVLGTREGSALQVEPRVGAGRAFMDARANNTSKAVSAQDVYLDVALGAQYSLAIARDFSAGLSAELGYAAGPIGYADDAEVARVSGPFTSLLAYAALRL